MERKERESYPSDLTDEQWEEIAPLYTGMRNCTWSKRELTDAVLYLVDSGCKWRQLPHDFPPYSTVHSFYRRARISGLWNKNLYSQFQKTAWTVLLPPCGVKKQRIPAIFCLARRQNSSFTRHFRLWIPVLSFAVHDILCPRWSFPDKRYTQDKCMLHNHSSP